MTRKDYELIAEAISNAKTRGEALGINTDGIFFLQGFLGSQLRFDNPRFDQAKFDRACERKGVAA